MGVVKVATVVSLRDVAGLRCVRSAEGPEVTRAGSAGTLR